MTGLRLADLPTPCLILDRGKVDANIARLAARARFLGAPLRPHGKTPKSIAIARRMMQAGAIGLTVSTLLEAEAYFEGGISDLFYAVALAPSKAARAVALKAKGAALVCQVDHPVALDAIAAAARDAGETLPLAIEIDVDGHRTGAPVGGALFREIVEGVARRPELALTGIMSYGGASYECRDGRAMGELAERHRKALTETAAGLRAAGHDISLVSFGSTPAILNAASMKGVTELRCGTHVFQDLFQSGIGACRDSDIAISVLSEVISHQPDRNRLIIDAGGLALSMDRSAAASRDPDPGFGLVCEARTGAPIAGLKVASVSQELGVVETMTGARLDFDRFPIGARVRILPNHADTAAAAHDRYHVVDGGDAVTEVWDRFNFW